MTTIIRRYRRRLNAPILAVVAAIVLLLAGILMLLWAKGGPQPVHEIVIALPAPTIPPAKGQSA